MSSTDPAMARAVEIESMAANPPVEAQEQRLKEAIANLEECIGELHRRLGPIVDCSKSADVPREATDNQVEGDATREGLSPMAEALFDMASGVEDCRVRVVELLCLIEF